MNLAASFFSEVELETFYTELMSSCLAGMADHIRSSTGPERVYTRDEVIQILVLMADGFAGKLDEGGAA